MKNTEWDSSVKNAALDFMLSKMPDLPFSPRVSCEIPSNSATHLTRPADWCVFKLSAMIRHFNTSKSDCTVCLIWAKKSSSVRLSVMLGLIIFPVTTSKFAIKHFVPCRSYSYSCFRICPAFMGKSAALRPNAWIPVFSSVLTVFMPSPSHFSPASL